jgi:signal transduction histidine kinase
MRHTQHHDLERQIAATRIVLSVVTIVSVYVDPTQPVLTRWFSLTGGPFAIDAVALTAMTVHLVYAGAIYCAVTWRVGAPGTLSSVATILDILFGAAVALVTEGATSPAYVFFAFAILAVGCRSGLRATLGVAAVCVTVYTVLIFSSARPSAESFAMRPAYLALTGVLIGYLGQKRLDVEARLRTLEAAAEREKLARSLHDGHMQTLAGMNLALQSCCELLRRGRPDDVLNEITQLRSAVAREHHELRAYIRSLVEMESRTTASEAETERELDVSLHTAISGSGTLVEGVLRIIGEGVRNAQRHARARRVVVSAVSAQAALSITIDDDGVGFPPDAPLPWSIVSRAKESGGRVQLALDKRPGAHLIVEIPLA